MKKYEYRIQFDCPHCAARYERRRTDRPWVWLGSRREVCLECRVEFPRGEIRRAGWRGNREVFEWRSIPWKRPA